LKRAYVVALMVLIAIAVFTGAAGAEIPGEFTLSINAGYPITLGELELEYKNGPWAGGVNTAFVGSGIEMGMFGRYYVPLGAGFNFYVSLNPSMVVTFASPPEIKGLIKAGPGFDFRWQHLRVNLEGGVFYIIPTTFTFYFKGGLGVIF
jgi:hypothetical protein